MSFPRASLHIQSLQQKTADVLFFFFGTGVTDHDCQIWVANACPPVASLRQPLQQPQIFFIWTCPCHNSNETTAMRISFRLVWALWPLLNWILTPSEAANVCFMMYSMAGKSQWQWTNDDSEQILAFQCSPFYECSSQVSLICFFYSCSI